MNKQRKRGKFAWLFEEWVAQLGLTAMIVFAVVDTVMGVNGGGLL